MSNLILLVSAMVTLAPANVDLTINQAAMAQETVDAIELKLDPRVKKINTYFAKRNMPLEGHGEQFVLVADKYGLDWTLLPAIAVRESSGGKRLLNNNPFGWGSAKIPFNDFDHAIDVVGWNLSGNNENTARYYADNTSEEKLYWYNGTVLPSYPAEVLHIMGMFEDTNINA